MSILTSTRNTNYFANPGTMKQKESIVGETKNSDVKSLTNFNGNENNNSHDNVDASITKQQQQLHGRSMASNGFILNKIKSTFMTEVLMTPFQRFTMNKVITELKMNDGFSLTIDGQTPEALGFNTGYMVAPLKQTELKFNINEFNNNSLKQLFVTVKALEKALDGKYGQIYAGCWCNPETNQFELDASVRVDNLEDALYIANAGDQASIFNLATFELIFTSNGIAELQQKCLDGSKGRKYEQLKQNLNYMENVQFGEKFENNMCVMMKTW